VRTVVAQRIQQAAVRARFEQQAGVRSSNPVSEQASRERASVRAGRQSRPAEQASQSRPVSEHAFESGMTTRSSHQSRPVSEHAFERESRPVSEHAFESRAGRCQQSRPVSEHAFESGMTIWSSHQKHLPGVPRQAPRTLRTRTNKPTPTLLRHTKPTEDACRGTKANAQTHNSRRAPRPHIQAIQNSR
jgi:hypothetical protein